MWPLGRKSDEIVVDGVSVLPLDVWGAIESVDACAMGLFQVIRTARQVDRLRLRVGYAPHWSQRLDAVRDALMAAVLTIYIVLGILYESYIHPITILSTLPSAGVGAVLALMFFQTDLSVIAIIGILGTNWIVKVGLLQPILARVPSSAARRSPRPSQR